MEQTAAAWLVQLLRRGGPLPGEQRGQFSISTRPGSYVGIPTQCNSVVQTTFSLFADVNSQAVLGLAVLAVDFAISPDSAELAVVASGNATMPGVAQVLIYSMSEVTGSHGCVLPAKRFAPSGQATAIVSLDGGWVAQIADLTAYMQSL